MEEELKCLMCNDSGWVCEKHPNFEHEHKIIKWFIFIVECSGAGMPCICNTHNPPWNYPDKTRIEVNRRASKEE